MTITEGTESETNGWFFSLQVDVSGIVMLELWMWEWTGETPANRGLAAEYEIFLWDLTFGQPSFFIEADVCMAATVQPEPAVKY